MYWKHGKLKVTMVKQICFPNGIVFVIVFSIQELYA